MKSVFCGVFFFCLSAFVSATDSQTWTEYKLVGEILAAENGGIVIIFEEPLHSICQLGGKAAHVWPGSQGVSISGAQNMLSLVLLAQTTQRKIALRYSAASSSCYVRQVKIER